MGNEKRKDREGFWGEGPRAGEASRPLVKLRPAEPRASMEWEGHSEAPKVARYTMASSDWGSVP